ncbi:hypothetical protein INT45_003585 [Circinella minor]|uniref:Transcription activator GCR1-like domain-containing protein n=1 Tax=Circinella minor TaxID=1195481 RepID=A0A8H7RQI2_9FUNG|nr:hypothetical protein INT45_003585 [Circinella minor]
MSFRISSATSSATSSVASSSRTSSSSAVSASASTSSLSALLIRQDAATNSTSRGLYSVHAAALATNAEKEAESSREAIELKSQIQRKKTKQSYAQWRKRYLAWCAKEYSYEVQPGVFETDDLVSEVKLLRFLKEEVETTGNQKKRRGNDGGAVTLQYESYSQCLKAIIDLWKDQKAAGKNDHPHPRGDKLNTWRKAKQISEKETHRANNVDRGIGTLEDGYNFEEMVAVSLYFFDRQSETEMRNRATFLLHHMMLLRGESSRFAELADLFTMHFPEEGHSPCPVLIFHSEFGKTTTIFPEADTWLERINNGDGCEKTIAAQGFLRLLITMRTIILQDAAMLRRSYPNHRLFQQPIFQDDEYRTFEASLVHACQTTPSPAELRLQSAIPDVSRRLDAIDTKLEMHQRVQIEAQLDRFMSGHFRFVPGSSHTETINGTTSQLNAQSRPTASSTNLTSERPMYHLNRSIKTVTEVWREWSVGLTPESPAVSQLEDEFGASWRQDQAERQAFSRRLNIIKAVNDIAEQKGIPADERFRAAEMLDEAMNRRGWKSLNALINDLKGNANVLNDLSVRKTF